MGVSFMIVGIAGISSIASILTICGMGWIVGSQFANINGKLERFGLPDPDKYTDCTSRYSTADCTMYKEVVTELEARWRKNQPVLITCSFIIILVGILQLTISLVVSYSNPKNTRKRARLWIISHFVFMLILLICLIATYLTRTGFDFGMGMKSWSELVAELCSTLKNIEPSQDFTSLSTFLTIGAPLFYCVGGTDFILTIALFCIGILILHKYDDYESQE